MGHFDFCDEPELVMNEFIEMVKICLRLYMSEELDMTEIEIEKAISDYDLEEKIKDDKPAYKAMTIQQVAAMVLGMNC